MEKDRKPRPKQPGTQIQVRIQPEPLALLDGWIASHPDPKPSRPEAIRRIVSYALGIPDEDMQAILSMPPLAR